MWRGTSLDVSVSLLVLASLLLGTLAALYCFTRLVSKARSRVVSTDHDDFPEGSLPSHVPAKDWKRGLKLHPLQPCQVLTEAFLGREAVDYDTLYILQPRSLPLDDSIELALVCHASRCGTTLFCRLLDARTDVITYREPLVLSNLLERVDYAFDMTRSHIICLVRAVLHLFMVDACRRGARLAVVKLASCCSRSARLWCLHGAAPRAHRVQITRSIDDIVRSHERDRATQSEESAQIERDRAEAKHDVCAAWAQTHMDYDVFGGTESNFSALSSALGLPVPTNVQLAAMKAEALVDAKLGGLRTAPDPNR